MVLVLQIQMQPPIPQPRLNFNIKVLSSIEWLLVSVFREEISQKEMVVEVSRSMANRLRMRIFLENTRMLGYCQWRIEDPIPILLNSLSHFDHVLILMGRL